jgi:DNA-binding NtrC family response regulator
MPHALIVDDDVETCQALAKIAQLEGFTTTLAHSLRDARIQLSRQQSDVILVDLGLPDGEGIDLFEGKPAPAGMQLVLITGNASLDTSIQALRLGATDYLIKPINPSQLRSILARVVDKPAELKGAITSLRGELRKLGRFGHLIGGSPVMQRVYDQIERVAPTAASVLIIGESGTGKEVVAQTLHDQSRRNKAPFLAVNCGAISPNLMESELFGHERGSFTGAVRDHKGLFERAHGGTLFLDEVSEMPIDLQVKLLRVLETGMFRRVGSDRETETDVRVLAATNRIPEEAVAQGKLREDLLYRLQVFPLRLPPLRDRSGDIAVLAQHFLARHNEESEANKTFAPGALALLGGHLWPGNVRELRNVIHRAFIMANEIIDEEHLPVAVAASPKATGPTFIVRVGQSIAEVERNLIEATLAENQGNKERVAEILGVSLKTLYNRLAEYRENETNSSTC